MTLTSTNKRQHETQKIVGDPLTAEIREKLERLIKYQMTIARLPLAKEIDEFDSESTPVKETLVRDLAGGAFLEQQRNLVLIGGTGTGKSQLVVSIVRTSIGNGARRRFFNVVSGKADTGIIRTWVPSAYKLELCIRSEV